MVIERNGSGGITAKLICDSVNEYGDRISTYELTYPRFIHSELMTHRAFSRNASSSRAIPVNKIIQAVLDGAAKPVHWGKNQRGMQASEELDSRKGEQIWKNASFMATEYAGQLHRAGYHKQLVNRILEPFQFMKTIVTATEWDNWFWLRDHADAQPEIALLAKLMKGCRDASVPSELAPGEWHLPYVETRREPSLSYFAGGEEVSLTDALKVSASCCAQVSFRLLNESLEKAVEIYDRLVDSEPVHASPFEHQATPMKLGRVEDIDMLLDCFKMVKESGEATHIDLDGAFWSGNFKGWVQHRQLIPNNVKRG